MPTQFSFDSTEFVRVQVSATEFGQPVDMSDTSVWMTLLADGTHPQQADWVVAQWESDLTVTPAKYFARALLSLFTVVADTHYDVWITFTDGEETVIDKAGFIYLYS